MRISWEGGGREGMRGRDRKVLRFFDLIKRRRIDEAGKILGEIAGELDGSRGDDGYLKALEGILMSVKYDHERYLYIPRILRGEVSKEEAKVEFRRHLENELHDDYDRGFFQALIDFLDNLP